MYMWYKQPGLNTDIDPFLKFEEVAVIFLLTNQTSARNSVKIVLETIWLFLSSVGRLVVTMVTALSDYPDFRTVQVARGHS